MDITCKTYVITTFANIRLPLLVKQMFPIREAVFLGYYPVFRWKT